jgi:2-keto-4-pentenoate hydratase
MEPVWQDERVRRGITTQLKAREEQLAAGARPLGWKVGFGTPAQQEKRGVTGAVVGFLLETPFSAGEPLPVGGWARAVIEPELAVHLGRDVEGGSDRETVAAAIAGVGAAYEMVDADPAITDLEQILATNIFNRGVLLGDVDTARAGGDASGVAVRVFRDGEEVGAEDDPVAAVGDLVAHTQHVANLLAELGGRLRAGDAVITGAIVPKLEVEPGQEWRTDFGPLGELTARFTD